MGFSAGSLPRANCVVPALLMPVVSGKGPDSGQSVCRVGLVWVGIGHLRKLPRGGRWSQQVLLAATGWGWKEQEASRVSMGALHHGHVRVEGGQGKCPPRIGIAFERWGLGTGEA